MRVLSVCSGIDAAALAWSRLGWSVVAFSEIEPFPAAVLRHHHPGVPNWGDVTRCGGWPDAAIDVLVGGTPCQSFSVAGLRAGLADPRGSVLFAYLAVARKFRPRWVVWENVPGVLSIDDGRAFGSLLGSLAVLGYGFAYRILDARHFGLAQRRRRVFVVGHLGNWRRAAAVLVERAGLSGDFAPSGGPSEDLAGTLGGSSHTGGVRTTDLDNHGAFIPVGAELSDDDDDPTVIAFDTTQITHPENRCNPQPGDPCHPLAADAHPPAIVFDGFAEVADPVAANQSNTYTREGSKNFRLSNVAVSATQVRRLTPREAERLQGFPDDYTAITYRGKPAKDGPRYRALGNAMAVPVMYWIGQRMQMVEALGDEPL